MFPTACFRTPSTVLRVDDRRFVGVELDLKDQWNAAFHDEPVRLNFESVQALAAAGETTLEVDVSAGPAVEASGSPWVTVTRPSASVVTRISVVLPSGCVSLAPTPMPGFGTPISIPSTVIVRPL